MTPYRRGVSVSPPCRRQAGRPTVEVLEGRLLLSTVAERFAALDEAVPTPGADAEGGVPGSHQVFYLDVDAAEGVAYRGPIRVDDVEVPGIRLPDELNGQRKDVLAAMQRTLADDFEGIDVTFTTEAPAPGLEYSTIYIGGDGSDFAQYGQFYGLAERVDVGNRDRSDRAFVFADAIPIDARSAATYGRELAGYVAHEAGHLLGLAHDHESPVEGPLDSVAFKPYTHIEPAGDVQRELMDSGRVTIAGHSYEVNPRIVEAIRSYPAYYYGGAVGPDGLPDIVMGQGVIHPVSAGIWVSHVLDLAWKAQGVGSPYSPVEQQQILAWSYGFATHAAGDIWAHTLVNEFGGGPFPDLINVVQNPDSFSNAVRHFVVESIIEDATPGFDGIRNQDPRTQLPDGDVSDNGTPARPLDAPHAFLYDAFLKDLPDLPGQPEKSLFRATTRDVSDLEGLLRSLDAATFHPALGVLFSARHVILEEPPSVKVVQPGRAWEIQSAYSSFILRRQTDARGNTLLDVAEQVKSRGAIVDVFLKLRKQLVELQASLPAPDPNFGEPLAAEVDAILTAGQSLIHGQGLGDTSRLTDAFKSIFSKVSAELQGIFGAITRGDSTPNAELLKVANSLGSDASAYLRYWISNIDIGLQHWSELGLETSQALFDPQVRRDVQNDEGPSYGPDATDPDFNDRRADFEKDVGILGTILHAVNEPNGPDSFQDSFLNKYLLPMIGLPRKVGELAAGIEGFFEELNDQFLVPARELLGDINPLDPVVDLIKKKIKEYLETIVKRFILERYGVDVDVIEALLKSPRSLTDLASVTYHNREYSAFRPNDRARLDAYMGFSGTNHRVLDGDGSNTESTTLGDGSILKLTFYPGALGGLKADAEFDKQKFAAYANTVTLAKMLLLQEKAVGPDSAGAADPKTISHLLTDLVGQGYDFAKMNLNGTHGGDIMTATMPGATDLFGAPADAGTLYPAPVSSDLWFNSIDYDHDWRQDSQTELSQLYRFHDRGTGKNVVRWTFNGLTPGRSYIIQADWMYNNRITNQGTRNPTQHAPYVVDNGAQRILVPVDQSVFPDGVAATPAGPGVPPGVGQIWKVLGRFTPVGTSLVVTLSDDIPDGDFVVAGRIRLEPVGDPSQARVVARGGAGYSETSALVPGSGAVSLFGWTSTQPVDSSAQLNARLLPQGLRDQFARNGVSGALFMPSDFASDSLFASLTSIPLVKRLVDHNDPLSQYLWGRLLDTQRRTLADPLVPALKKAEVLSAGLNAILSSGSIYDPNRFSGVTLLRRTGDLLAQNLTSFERLIRLNRWLLEDAYPAEAPRSLDDDFVVKPLTPGPGWLVVPQRKADGSVSNVKSYDEPYTVVLDPAAGRFLVYRDWQQIAYPTGRGNFTLWESDVLRQKAFRVLFRDWQNGADQFPELGDTPTHDGNLLATPPTYGAFPAYRAPSPILIAPVTGDLIVSGNRTMHLTGDLGFANIVGNNDGTPDSLTLFVDGRITITGFVGGRGLKNITIVSPDGIIVVDEGATISTRQVAAGANHWQAPSIGDSGNITLNAPTILIGAGANLLAAGDATHAGGTVSLIAAASVNLTWKPFGISNFKASQARGVIDVGDGANLTGRDVRILATATTTKQAIQDQDFSRPVTATVMGDLNGDGRADLIVGTRGQGLYAYPSTNGKYRQATVLDLGDFVTTAMTLADVDGDHDLDLLVGVANGPIRLYRNAGGVLSPGVPIDATARRTTALAVGDINGDGRADLIVGTEGGLLVYRYGAGAFGPPASLDASTGRVTAMALADLNKDGRPELIVGVANGPIRLYRNAGGVLSPGVPIDATARRTTALAVGDINGDGRADLIVGTDGGGLLRYADSGGVFGAATTIDASAGGVTSLALADLDGDNRPDLVVGSSSRPNRIFRNVGGRLDQGHDLGGTQPTAAVAVGQVDGVAGLDLVIGNDRRPSQLYHWQTLSGVGGYLAGEDIDADDQLASRVNVVEPAALSTKKAAAVQSEAEATVAIHAGASIRAERDIQLVATARSAADLTTFQGGWGITYGSSAPTATIDVENGVRINAAGRFDMDAHATNVLNVLTLIPGEGESSNLALSLGIARSTSSALVEGGAMITAHDVAIRARNENSYRNTALATGYNTKSGKSAGYAATAALGFYQSNATAEVAGIVRTAGDLFVDARSINSKDVTRSFGAVSSGSGSGSNSGQGDQGPDANDQLFQGIKALLDSIGLSQKIGGRDDQEVKFNSSSVQDGYAVGIALVTADNKASALIGDGARIVVGRDLKVTSEARDPFQVLASGNSGSVGQTKETSFGGALAYSKVANQANAFIGWNADVDVARTLTLDSNAHIDRTVKPLDLILTVAGLGTSTPAEALGQIYRVLKPLAGSIKGQLDSKTSDYVQQILDEEDQIGTSYVQAGGATESGGKTIAGGVNLLYLYNASAAGIAGGARVNRKTGPRPIDQDVIVHATGAVDTVNLAGNASVLNFASDESARGFGGFLDVILAQDSATASVSDLAAVSAGRDISVTSHTTDKMTNVVEAGSSTEKSAVDGAFLYARSKQATTAYLDNRSVVDAGRDLTIGAEGDLRDYDFTPSFGHAGELGAGVAVSIGDVRMQTRAFIGDPREPAPLGGYGGAPGSVRAGRNLSLTAKATPVLWNIAASAGIASSSDKGSGPGGNDKVSDAEIGGSYGIGISGSVGFSSVDDVVEASIRDAAAVNTAGATTLSATSHPLVVSGSGSFSSGDDFGFAGDFTQVQVAQLTRAFVENASIKAGRLGLLADSGATIVAIAAGGSVSDEGFGGAGAVPRIVVDGFTYADLDHGTSVDAGEVAIDARNDALLVPIGGSVGVGDVVGLGASVNLVDVRGEVRAWIDGARVASRGPVRVAADGTIEIDSVAVSVGVSSDGVAGAGSASSITMNNTVDAHIAEGSAVSAGGDLSVTANTHTTVNAVTGNVAGASVGSLGASATINDLNDTTTAYIATATIVAASIMVQAESIAKVLSAAAGGGGAEDFALDASIGITEENLKVLALIGDESDVRANGSVTVQARGDLSLLAGSGTGAGAEGAAIGGSFSFNDATVDVSASLRDSSVHASQGVNVTASSSPVIRAIAGAGAGAEGVAAVVGYARNRLTTTVLAYDLGCPIVEAGGDVTIKATDDSEIRSAVGDGAGAAGVAIGASRSDNTLGNTVGSFIDRSTVRSLGAGVSVIASSNATIRAIAAGGAGAEGVALVGSQSNNEITNVVGSRISGSSVVSAAGALKVLSTDNSDITARTGGGGGAVIAAIGAAWSKNKMTIRDTAFIDSSRANAASVEIKVTASPWIDSIAGAGAGALYVAAGASIAHNTLDALIDAYISGKSVVVARTGDLTVRASEDVTRGGPLLPTSRSISAISGSGAGAAGLAVGDARSTNVITSNIKAYVNASTVTAIGGALTVLADSKTKIVSITMGGFGAYIAAGGGSVSTDTINSTVDAHVSGGASLAAGGPVAIMADDQPVIWSLAGVGAGAAGLAIGQAKGTNDIKRFVTSNVDGSSVRSGSGVNVEASSKGDIKTGSIGGFGAFVAAGGGAESFNSITGMVDARVTGGAVLRGSGMVVVKAIDGGSIIGLAGTGAGAAGAAFGSSRGRNSIKGTVKAVVEASTVQSVGSDVVIDAESRPFIFAGALGGAGAYLAAGGGSISTNEVAVDVDSHASLGASVSAARHVSVLANNAPKLTVGTGQSAGAAVVGIGIARSSITIGGSAKAYLDAASVIAAGNLMVQATAKVTLLALTSGGAVSAIGISSGTESCTINPTIDAHIANRATAVAGGNLTVHAGVTYELQDYVGGINSGIVGVGSSKLDTDLGATVDAYVGTGSALTSNGTVTISAGLNAPQAKFWSIEGSGGGVTIESARAVVHSHNRVAARLDTDATVKRAAALEVLADTNFTHLDVRGLGLELSVLAVGGAVTATAEDLGTTSATIGDGLVLGGTSGGPSTLGRVRVASTYSNQSTAKVVMATGGVALLNKTNPATARVSPTIRASIGASRVTTLGDVVVSTISEITAKAEALGISVGAVPVGANTAEVVMTPSLSAAIASGAVVRAGGSVVVEAAHNRSNTGGARASASSPGGGLLVAVQGAESAATAAPDVVASIGAGDIQAGQDVTIRSTVQNLAHAEGNGLGASTVVGIGEVRTAALAGVRSGPKGDVRATISASLATGGRVRATNLIIQAASADAAESSGGASAGGIVGVTSGHSGASVRPSIAASLADGTNVVVTGDVRIRASGLPEADTRSRGTTGGLVAVGNSSASLTVDPIVSATVGRHVSISAGRDVLLEANCGEIKGTSSGTFNAGSVADGGDVDIENDTVRVRGHQLVEGDQVVYDPSGQTRIGGLGDGSEATGTREYNVIRVDDNRIRLGSTFDAARVDPVRDLITFATPHNFEEGDLVIYHARGSAPIVGPGSDGQRFRVHVVDELTIQLVTPEQTNLDPRSFDPSQPGVVDSSTGTISIPDHEFIDGEAVQYHAPQAEAFTSALVDVGVDPASGDLVRDADGNIVPMPGRNNIYLPNVDKDGDPDGVEFENGEAVVYHADGPKQVLFFPLGHRVATGDAVVYRSLGGRPIGGLVDGRTYYAIALDDRSLELAATRENAVQGLAITLDPTGAGASQRLVRGGTNLDFNPNAVRAAVIGGLVDGQTYYVITKESNPALSRFEIQLARTVEEALGILGHPVTPIALRPQRANSADRSVGHTLSHIHNRALAGLVDGATYYVRDVTGGSFRLAATPAGPAIGIRADGVEGMHAFVPAGIALTPSTGIQELTIDLTAASGGTQRFVGPGGVPLSLISPVHDGKSSASTTGSAGGFVGLRGMESDAFIRLDVTATVLGDAGDPAATAIRAGRDATVRTDSTANASAGSRNRTGAFVGNGNASSSLTIDNVSRATIGAGVLVNVGHDFKLSANATQIADASSNARGLGLLDYAKPRAKVTISYETTAIVGRGARIVAGNALTADSLTKVDAHATADAKASGVVVLPRSRAEVLTTPGRSTTGTRIEEDASLDALTIALIAEAPVVAASARASASARACIYGAPDADTNVQTNDATDLHILAGARIAGRVGVRLASRIDRIVTSSDAFAETRLLLLPPPLICIPIGNTVAKATNIADMTANLTVDVGAIINAGPSGGGPNSGLVVEAVANGDEYIAPRTSRKRARIDFGKEIPTGRMSIRPITHWYGGGAP